MSMNITFKVLLLVLLCIGLIIGKREPSLNDIDIALEKEGQAISESSWDRATEQMSEVYDNWNYHRSDYSKKDVQAIEKKIEQNEMALAILNQKKAMKSWKELKRKWQEINPQISFL